VWQARFAPAEGAEANKTRPCVVVSNDAANRAVERLARGVVTVVPLTSNISRVYSFQAFVPASAGTGVAVDSKAQAEQVRSLDYGRLVKRLGTLDAEQMGAIDAALTEHLNL